MVEISSFYICVPKTTIIWATVLEKWSEKDFLSFWATFTPPNNWHKQNFQKTEKSIWRCHHFKLVQQKTWPYDLSYSDMECNRHYFCSFTPLLKNLIENVKNAWRYHPFTHMYHKSRSYDAWLLWYKVYLCHFLPFDPPDNPQNQNLEKNENT